MNTAELVEAFATGTYTRTRTTAGTYSAGRYSAGSTATASIRASVQPLTGRDLMVLPEGRRGDATVAVYTTTELRVTSPAGAADKLTIDGETWEIIHVEPWVDNQSTTVYRAIAARTTPSGGP